MVRYLNFSLFPHLDPFSGGLRMVLQAPHLGRTSPGASFCNTYSLADGFKLPGFASWPPWRVVWDLPGPGTFLSSRQRRPQVELSARFEVPRPVSYPPEAGPATNPREPWAASFPFPVVSYFFKRDLKRAKLKGRGFGPGDLPLKERITEGSQTGFPAGRFP